MKQNCMKSTIHSHGSLMLGSTKSRPGLGSKSNFQTISEIKGDHNDKHTQPLDDIISSLIYHPELDIVICSKFQIICISYFQDIQFLNVLKLYK